MVDVAVVVSAAVARIAPGAAALAAVVASRAPGDPDVVAAGVAVATGAVKGLAWLLGGVIALLLIVLCVPVRARAKLENVNVREFAPEDVFEASSGDETGRWSVHVDWLWGAVRFRSLGVIGEPAVRELRAPGFRRETSPKGHKGESRRTRRRRTTGGKHASKRRRTLRGLANTFGLVRGLLADAEWFAPRFWRALGLKVSGDLVYGFPDPFLTGMSQAVLAFVPWPSELGLTPDFSQGRLSGSVRGRAVVYPIAVVVLIVRAAFRPAVRELWWPRVRSALRWSKTA